MSRQRRPSTTPGEVAGPTPPMRRPVGARLRALRQVAGLRQSDLAARLGITQERISRLELEALVPTGDLVGRYLDALGVGADVRREVLDELAEQLAEAATWRRLHRAGLREHHRRYGEEERTAAVVRNWSDRIVPGLLQTAAYARAMCAVWDVPGLDIDGVVGGRLERQQVLRDPSRRFEFILSEAALRTADVPREILAEQLSALVLAAAAGHVEVGVIPETRMIPASTDFRIYDDRVVVVDLDTRELRITEPHEVERYLAIFERLRSLALRDDDLAELVRNVRQGGSP